MIGTKTFSNCYFLLTIVSGRGAMQCETTYRIEFKILAGNEHLEKVWSETSKMLHNPYHLERAKLN